MTSGATVENCIDIIRPFRDELEAGGLLTRVQFMGGIGSAALTNEATLILPDLIVPDEGMIVAPDDLYLPNRRDDGNKRDMDVLVRATDEDVIKEVEGIAKETVGDKLDISIFGFRDGEYVKRQLQNPVRGWKPIKTFVSDRYVFGPDDESPIEITDGDARYVSSNGMDVDKVVFPFGVRVPSETLKSFWLKAGDFTIPVALPPATLMNYGTRSISGLRPKDAVKVQTMASNIFKQVPDYVDWIRSGPGRSQLELARALHSLKGPSNPERAGVLVLGGAVQVEPMPIRSLMGHESFMLRDFDRRTQENALAWARVKSAVLAKAESYEEVVTLYQRWAEKLFDGISKNK